MLNNQSHAIIKTNSLFYISNKIIGTPAFGFKQYCGKPLKCMVCKSSNDIACSSSSDSSMEVIFYCKILSGFTRNHYQNLRFHYKTSFFDVGILLFCKDCQRLKLLETLEKVCSFKSKIVDPCAMISMSFGKII